MSEPTFTPATELFWRERIPDFYREADANNGWAFKKFVSVIFDRYNEFTEFFTRFNFVQPGESEALSNTTSDLTDPNTADASWLTWLAQLAGVTVTPSMTIQEQRDAISDSVSGYLVGTKTAIAAAAKTALTGTKYAQVFDHSDGVTAIGAASMWDVLIITRADETPDIPLVLATIERKKAKPAGVILHHRAYSASWNTIESTYPTWTSLEAHTWDEIELTGA